MDIDQARKKLDALTLQVHQQLEAFEEQTGLKVRRIEVDRWETTSVHTIDRTDTLAGLRIEATL